MIVVCGSCNKTLNVDDRLVGKLGRCPVCQASIQIPSTDRSVMGMRSLRPPAEPGEADAKPSDQMLVICGTCGKTLRVGRDVAGQLGRCPNCQTVVRIPVPEGAQQEGALPRVTHGTARKRQQPAPAPGSIPALVTNWPIAIIFLICGLLAGFIIGHDIIPRGLRPSPPVDEKAGLITTNPQPPTIFDREREFPPVRPADNLTEPPNVLSDDHWVQTTSPPDTTTDLPVTVEDIPATIQPAPAEPVKADELTEIPDAPLAEVKPPPAAPGQPQLQMDPISLTVALGEVAWRIFAIDGYYPAPVNHWYLFIEVDLMVVRNEMLEVPLHGTGATLMINGDTVLPSLGSRKKSFDFAGRADRKPLLIDPAQTSKVSKTLVFEVPDHITSAVLRIGSANPVEIGADQLKLPAVISATEVQDAWYRDATTGTYRASYGDPVVQALRTNDNHALNLSADDSKLIVSIPPIKLTGEATPITGMRGHYRMKLMLDGKNSNGTLRLLADPNMILIYMKDTPYYQFIFRRNVDQPESDAM